MHLLLGSTRGCGQREFEVFRDQRPGQRWRRQSAAGNAVEGGIPIDPERQIRRSAERRHERPPFFKIRSRNRKAQGRRSRKSPGCLHLRRRRRQRELREFQRVAPTILALHVGRDRQFAGSQLCGRAYIERKANLGILGRALPRHVHGAVCEAGRAESA